MPRVSASRFRTLLEAPLRQRCKLQQARVQPLQLAFRHRVEVDPTNPLLGTRALQPTEENLSSTGIGNGTLTQTTLDLPRHSEAPVYGGLLGREQLQAFVDQFKEEA